MDSVLAPPECFEVSNWKGGWLATPIGKVEVQITLACILHSVGMALLLRVMMLHYT